MRVLLATAVAALAASTAQAKVFVFKADACNTNFNDDANWLNLDATDDGATLVTPLGSGDAAPEEVTFGDGADHFESVDVKVSAGDYELGGLVLQDDMVLSLDEDGVVITFSEDAVGPAAQFVAGQTTEKGACSLGCHSNFYEYLGRDKERAAIDYDRKDSKGISDDFVEAEASPCGSDTVVVPEGFNVNVLALGVHAFKEILYVQDGEVIYVEAPSQLPEFMLFPTADQKVIIGGDANDQCADAGVSDRDGNCVCASECLRDTDSLAEANNIRAAAKSWAQYASRDFEEGDSRQFDFTYARAWTTFSGMSDDCTIKASSVGANLEDESFDQMSFDGNPEISLDYETRSVRISGRIEAFGGLLDGQRNQFTGPLVINAVEDGEVAADNEVDQIKEAHSAAAARVFAAVIKTMERQCRVDDKSTILSIIGWDYEQSATTTIYAGGNLPQIDVNRLVDDNNKEGVVTAVFEAIKDIAGWEDLEERAILEGWKLVGPEARHKGRREAPIRHGYATNLIQVDLEYSRYGGASGLDETSVRNRINHVLATYDTTTHHRCFTFEFGFDDTCIEELVANAIGGQLGECTVNAAEACRETATASALEIILEIRGCGLLGTITNDAGLTVCADPEAQAAAAAAAAEQATAAVEKALGVVFDQYNAAVQAAADAALLKNQTAAERAASRETEMSLALGDVVRVILFQTTAAALTDLLGLKTSEQEDADAALADAQAALDALACPDPSADTTVIGGGQIGAEVDEAAEAAAAAEKAACADARDLVEASDFQSQKTAAVVAEVQTALTKQIAAEELQAIRDQTAAAGGVVTPEAPTEEEMEAQQAKVNAAQKAADDACATGESAMCEALQAALEAATAAMNALDDQLAASKIPPPSDGIGMSTIIIAAVGAIIVIAIVIAIVVLGGGAAAAADPRDGDGKAVIAFENPMYDDPSQAADLGGYAEAGNDDQGLYDEPTFNADDGGEGGGYLDVEPDDDDEDEEEDEEEEEEDDEEDESDDE
jgi:hypothetical protein